MTRIKLRMSLSINKEHSLHPTKPGSWMRSVSAWGIHAKSKERLSRSIKVRLIKIVSVY